MSVFAYTERETGYLSRADEQLGAAIEKIGHLSRGVLLDPFEALVSSIVAQQISGKAAETVFARLRALLGEVTPEAVVKANVEDIQKCGLSMRKAGYIKGIGEAACGGEVDFSALHMLSDEQIVAKLSSLRGVGVWTAEMLLIFSFCRPDVVSWGDLGIRRGMTILYGLDSLSREAFDYYRARYSPFGSVASLYLWEIASQPTAMK